MAWLPAGPGEEARSNPQALEACPAGGVRGQGRGGEPRPPGPCIQLCALSRQRLPEHEASRLACISARPSWP